MILPPGSLLFVGALGVACCVYAWLRVRAHRTQLVVQTLTAIVGQNVPLAQALRAAARHERGRLREIYDRIAQRLEVGDAVSTALRTSYPACPGHVIGALQAAELGGTLPSVLRALANDLQRQKTTVARFSPAVIYFFALALIVPSLLLGIVAFLVPKFRDIMLDFGITSHPALDAMAHVGDLLIRNSPCLLVVLGALALFCVQTLLSGVLLPRVPDRFQRIPALLDTIVWHLPVAGRISETRALARQLPIIQAAIRAGHDVAPAARQAACVDANYHARRRLRRFAQGVERGADPAALARALRFPQAVRRALSTARGQEDLATALDYLCSYYRSLLAHWEHVFVSAAVPCVVLTWAVCVGFIVVSVLTPVYAIVDHIIAEVW